MWNLQTLDGAFDGRRAWELDWHESVWGPELERLSIEQLGAASGLIFGRVTYEGMAAYWPTAEEKGEKGEIADLMNAIPKVVFSRTLGAATWRNTRLVKESAETEIARLKREPGKDLLLFGSANLADTLITHGLIDEFRICLAPLVMGGGSALFKPRPERIPLRLLESRPLTNGAVILRYVPARAGAAV